MLSPQITPDWSNCPKIADVRAVFGDSFKGPNLVQSLIGWQEKRGETLRSELSSYGLTFMPLTGGADLDTLKARASSRSEPEPVFSGAGIPVDEIISAGTRYGFHGINALTYQIIQGHWITNPYLVGWGHESTNCFFMMDDLSVGIEDKFGMDNYLAVDSALELLSLVGIDPTHEDEQLAKHGVILAIDLNGYRTFRDEAGRSIYKHTYGSSGHMLQAVTPPPEQFVKVIAAVREM